MPTQSLPASHQTWWDEELHGYALASMPSEWVRPAHVGPALGLHADKSYDVLRDLHSLGLVECKAMPFMHYGSVEGARVYYRRVAGPCNIREFEKAQQLELAV